MKKLLAMLFFALSLGFSSALFADACPFEGMKKFVDGLNLDATQKEKMKPVFETFKSKVTATVTKLRSVGQELNTAMMSDRFDEGKIDGLIDQKMQLVSDLMKSKMTVKAQLFGMLNDKQKAKFHEEVKMYQQKMEEKFKSCKEED